MEVTPHVKDGFTSWIPEYVNNRQQDFDTALFMKLLTAQLSQQDPFKPMESSEVYDSISKLANLDAQDKMNKKLTELSSSMSTMNAAGMIGLIVTGADVNGENVKGQVVRVNTRDGAAMLTVMDQNGNEHQMAMGMVQELGL